MNDNSYTVNNQIAPSSTEERFFNYINNKIQGSIEAGQKTSQKRIGYSPALLTLLTEGGINFFHYVKSLGLTREPNLIVLSSKHHYYYDENELKSVRILVNLKKLNTIKHLDMFFDSLFHILPQDVSFVGYFSDIKPLKVNNYQYNWFSNLVIRLKNFLGSKSEHLLDENKVTKLLKKNDLKITNMVRVKGLTYFYSQRNIYRQVEINRD